MKKENRKLSERIITCDCGLVIKRDTHSSGIQMERFLALLILSQKRLVVRQQLLKDFREKFFAINVIKTDSQPSNESFSTLSGVERTRRESNINKHSLEVS